MTSESREAEVCPSVFTLERLRHRELDDPVARTLDHHVRGCGACTARLSGQAPPPALDLDRVWRQRMAPEDWRARLPRVTWPRVAAGILGVVAVAVVMARSPVTFTVAKGSSWTVALIARTGEGVVGRILPGASLRPGDRLRFEVSSSGSGGHIALLSLDARGKVSPLYPVAGDTVFVAGGRRTLLAGAVELDDAVGGERVLLVACPRPVPVARIAEAGRAALSAAGGDPGRVNGLGLGCQEETFWINKVAR